MYSIKAIYDGSCFKMERPVPVKGKYEVIITFTEPVRQSQEDILNYCNILDREDVECIAEIIKEREKFSLGRTDYDFS
jgi:predicted DNA-binding antitoxin AbrB/MazE fold protein